MWSFISENRSHFLFALGLIPLFALTFAGAAVSVAYIMPSALSALAAYIGTFELGSYAIGTMALGFGSAILSYMGVTSLAAQAGIGAGFAGGVLATISAPFTLGFSFLYSRVKSLFTGPPIQKVEDLNEFDSGLEDDFDLGDSTKLINSKLPKKVVTDSPDNIDDLEFSDVESEEEVEEREHTPSPVDSEGEEESSDLKPLFE